MAAVIGVQELEMRLSGGAANSDPNLSLGGAKSTSVVLNQVPVFQGTPGTLTGVTLVDGGGFDPNGILTAHELVFDDVGVTLALNPSGLTQGPAVDVSVDDRYVLRGVSATGFPYVIVDVVAASLPVAPVANEPFDVTPQVNNLFDDVSGLEQVQGVTNYRCIYLENVNTIDTMFGVAIWLDDTDVLEQGTYAIGLDPAGINGTATTIVDEETAPAGVTFSSPTVEGSALAVGNLTPGDFQALWIRRVATANTLNVSGTSYAILNVSMLLDI